jgi:hypothetical protein
MAVSKFIRNRKEQSLNNNQISSLIGRTFFGAALLKLKN